MALNRLKSGYISNTTHDGGNAANAAVIGYSTANNRVEFIEATVDTSALDTISANVSNYSAQLTANINTIAANADTLVVGVDAAEASLDGVSDNIDSFAAYANSTFVSDGIAANTFVTIETNTLTEEGFSSNVTANVSSDVLTFTAGNGVAFLADATSQSITIAAKLSEIAHDRFTADGTANTFTLSREAAAADELIVYVDGVLQVPANNYIVSSTTLTLANVLPLINGTLVDVRHLPVSGSEGELSIIPPYGYRATNFLYQFGGIHQHSSSPAPSDVIEKISVTSDTDATDAGEISTAGGAEGACHSDEAAFVIAQSTVQKFSYASGTAESAVYSPYAVANNPSNYTRSGASTATFGYIQKEGKISKFPFASHSGGISVGNKAQGQAEAAVGVSETHGYYSGGQGPNAVGNSDMIQKHPFSSDVGTSDIGELQNSWSDRAGASSETHGYVMGGERYNGGSQGGIEKFSFASDSNSINQLSGARMMGYGGSAEGFGYFAGGANTNNIGSRAISKFPFSADTAMSSVGDLVKHKRRGGQHMASD